MKRLTTEEFIQQARKIHGDKYDYSKVDYVNCRTKVCIICPKHGEFWQTSQKHIVRAHGCPHCGGSEKLTTAQFIEKARLQHGDFYDYSETKYVDNRTKVKIICPKHGPFEQTPSNHLAGHKCKGCADEERYVKSQRDNYINFLKYITKNIK